jgi:hypothetical protein
MQKFLVPALLCCALAHADEKAAAAPAQAAPVIVELFTSEGCSSCPPADALLARLEKTQPVTGARIIALEEHVDYWNQLGWKDPFSSAQFRVRQNDYAVAAHVENVYTPQMVVNGQVGFDGGDANRAFQEIGRAAQAQMNSQASVTSIELSSAPNAKNAEMLDLSVRVTNQKTGKPRDANLYLVVTENELSTHIGAGENAGRTLRHAAVVRSFGVIGKMDSKGVRQGQVISTLRLPPEWHRENLRAVVFVQEKDTFRIAGASSIDLR